MQAYCGEGPQKHMQVRQQAASNDTRRAARAANRVAIGGKADMPFRSANVCL
jgi:hypothetical protein